MVVLKRGAAALLLPLLALLSAGDASARPLDAIHARGTLGECAHPNALPFASRKGDPPGFQIELGEAIAKELGVTLEPVWIIGPHQLHRADCDIVTDAIDDPEAQDETRLQLSKPYYRTGIVLAVREDGPITSADAIKPDEKVGVLSGSLAAMVLNQHSIGISTYGFEDEMLQAVVDKEIAAAAVSRAAAGYYNMTHPGHPIRIVDIDGLAPDFSWNVAVGMMKPDGKLRAAIDDALQHLTADGTIQRIYARYGIALQPPK
jgi:polar amino acid transport system substrate-binding protein